ncbi:MAG TPA: hypothetical protein VMT61_00850 [Candidatus Binataceae bacterium]|nr:hypothetical protein [Candidatus Binataceae bacterium]
MPLSNRQIERYSRQIIAEGVGGIAQERLLASRIALIGSVDDAGRALRYLVGAGVGFIHLSIDGATQVAHLIDQANAANPEVSVSPDLPDRVYLIVALIGSGEALRLAESYASANRAVPTIWVRLDTPERIALLHSSNVCFQCARGSLTAPFRTLSENAATVTMVAVTETLKLLMADPTNGSKLIEFDGYASSTTTIGIDRSRDCACRRDLR